LDRWLFALLVAAITSQLLPVPIPATVDAPSVSTVSISLPASIPSENVQIAYQLIGAFGGVSTYTDRRQHVESYTIDASVEGEAATEVKIVVYAAGCKIQTFDVLVSRTSNVMKDFVCEALPTVRLSGQVVPSDLVQGKNTVLTITYIAEWVNDFFGIMDGAVTHFEIATVHPSADGSFAAELPDFTSDATLPPRKGATFQLMLLEFKTLNAVADNLEPEDSDFRSEVGELATRSYYPGGLKFRVSTR
jgi:hypothetical protein